MRLAHFFVERPIFATVIAIVITLVGAFSYPLLPVAQFPQIAPPTISVAVTYPGASSEVVSETVLAPLEQQINGVENMLYMTSTAVANGQSQILIRSSRARISTRRRCRCRTASRSPSLACRSK